MRPSYVIQLAVAFPLLIIAIDFLALNWWLAAVAVAIVFLATSFGRGKQTETESPTRQSPRRLTTTRRISTSRALENKSCPGCRVGDTQ